MAKQVNFTHSNGTNYPASYWRITNLMVDVPNAVARFTFTGYKDEDARNEGKEPIGKRNIVIKGEDFAINFGKVTDKIKNPQEVGYDYASEYKDTTKTIQVPKTVVAEDGTESIILEEQEVAASFFENAINV